MFILTVLVCAVSGFFFTGSIITFTPLKGWLQQLIDDNAGSKITFNSVSGTALRLTLHEVKITPTDESRNLKGLTAEKVSVTFEYEPLLQNILILKTAHIQEGEIEYSLQSNDPTKLWASLPLDKITTSKTNLHVHNVSGWKVDLLNAKLDLRSNGKPGDKNFLIAAAVKSEHVAIHKLKLEKLDASVIIQPLHVEITDLKAKLGGGDLAVKATQAYGASNEINQLKVDLKKGDIGALLQELDYSSRFSGQVNLSMAADGMFTPKKKNLHGRGDFEISDVSVRVAMPKFPIHNDAPILLTMREIKNLKGKNSFVLEADKMITKGFDVENKNITLNGDQTVYYNKNISGQWTLNTNKKIADGIPGVARGIFAINEQGGAIIPFGLDGTTANPSVNVDYVIEKAFKKHLNKLNPLKLFGK